MKLKNRTQTLFFLAALYSAVGVFVLRYLMRMWELLPNGSLTEDAVIYKVLPIVCLLYAVGSVVIFLRIERHTQWGQLSKNPVPTILLFSASAFLCVGNLLLWLNGEAPASIYVASAPGFAEFLTKLLPPLGILAAICMGMFAYRCYEKKKPSALLYMCVSLYLAVRLIVCFQAWNTDPSIHDYCYALLANISAMLAIFHIAGFSFDKGKRRITLFFLMCTIIFCAITLADAIYDHALGEFFIHIALLVAAFANGTQLLQSTQKTESEPSM